jgi:hypothetical protein
MTTGDPEHFKLRYQIMQYLYDMFVEYPNASLDIRLIEDACSTNSKELNWNLAYLEKCGYLELGRSIELFNNYELYQYNI